MILLHAKESIANNSKEKRIDDWCIGTERWLCKIPREKTENKSGEIIILLHWKNEKEAY